MWVLQEAHMVHGMGRDWDVAVVAYVEERETFDLFEARVQRPDSLVHPYLLALNSFVRCAVPNSKLSPLTPNDQVTEPHRSDVIRD